MHESIKDLVEIVSTGFEVAGVATIVIGFAIALWRAYVVRGSDSDQTSYLVLRSVFGRSILLGLEILVAADLIRTVAVDPTLENLAVLAALVGLRTFLSWSLEVEIDGRWPWQRASSAFERRDRNGG